MVCVVCGKIEFRSIDQIEKTLLKQRFANLPTAQGGYIEKQKMALKC